jgi:alcohol dehydrogenase
MTESQVLNFTVENILYEISTSEKALLLISTSVYEIYTPTLIQDIGSHVQLIMDIPSNPTFQYVKNTIETLSHNDIPTLIIAIGGGSVIDLAKILKVIFLQGNVPLHFGNFDELSKLVQNSISNQFSKADLRLICYPTTTGSGSEYTHFATIWNDDETLQPKESLAHSQMLPDKVVYAPNLVKTIPKIQRVSGLLDATSHSLESLFSRNATKESLDYVSRALPDLLRLLHLPIEEWESEDFLESQISSGIAGKAINITKTGICHSISYPLTRDFGIPHGIACSISIPILLEEIKLQNLEGPYSEILNKMRLRDIISLKKLIDEILSEQEIIKFVRLKLGSASNFRLIEHMMVNPNRADNSIIKISDIFLNKLRDQIFPH